MQAIGRNALDLAAELAAARSRWKERRRKVAREMIVPALIAAALAAIVVRATIGYLPEAAEIAARGSGFRAYLLQAPFWVWLAVSVAFALPAMWLAVRVTAGAAPTAAQIEKEARLRAAWEARMGFQQEGKASG